MMRRSFFSSASNPTPATSEQYVEADTPTELSKAQRRDSDSQESVDESTPLASPRVLASDDVISIRSDSSSIFSTGTKTSVTTLPPQPVTTTHPGGIDVLLGQRSFRITARPQSIISISSYDTPAPPYSENPSLENVNTSTDSPSAPPESELESDSETETPVRARFYAPRGLTTAPSADTTRSSSPGSFRLPSPTFQAPHSAPLLSSRSRSPSPPSPPLSPISSTTNALSAHYTHVVRTIDSNHRAEISRLTDAHTRQLDATRHSIDAAYRAELRASHGRHQEATAELHAELDSLKLEIERLTDVVAHKSGETDSAREGFALREAELEVERKEAVRKARNEVEDVWEDRWRDRMRLAAEEVGAAWGEGRKVGRIWEDEVAKRWPKDVEDVREAVSGRLKHEKEGGKSAGSGSRRPSTAA